MKKGMWEKDVPRNTYNSCLDNHFFMENVLSVNVIVVPNAKFKIHVRVIKS